MHDELAYAAVPLLLSTLERLGDADLKAVPQSDRGVTYAEKITKAEAAIDWQRSATELDRHIRGLNPAPGAFFEYQGQRIKLLAARPVEGRGRPGEALDDQLTIACGEGALRLMILQPAGKAAMEAAAFLNGRPIRKGEVLG